MNLSQNRIRGRDRICAKGLAGASNTSAIHHDLHHGPLFDIRRQPLLLKVQA